MDCFLVMCAAGKPVRICEPNRFGPSRHAAGRRLPPAIGEATRIFGALPAGYRDDRRGRGAVGYGAPANADFSHWCIIR
jgi:hypothetical protein